MCSLYLLLVLSLGIEHQVKFHPRQWPILTKLCQDNLCGFAGWQYKEGNLGGRNKTEIISLIWRSICPQIEHGLGSLRSKTGILPLSFVIGNKTCFKICKQFFEGSSLIARCCHLKHDVCYFEILPGISLKIQVSPLCYNHIFWFVYI